jgi:predicted phage-related endonuclease|nr:MAG TPA: Exonuclease [Caudoviricetes sp.]
MKWLETNQLKIVPPKKPKKITGTRFAAIMGKNTWNTPFKTWCEITRTYEEPFEDTIYTIAGKVIEPKQAEYMRRAYFMTGLKTPTDIFGENYFKRTFGDFFKDEPIFGGMWDYLLYDESGKPTTVLEMKTTKRSEDWENDIPEYYALQAALYAYLLGVDSVMMVASFLEDKDYKAPEAFVPSSKNTIVIPFKISERYPGFDKLIKKAEKWWKSCVEGGVSPTFDEKKDANILKVLRTNTLNPETDIESVMEEAEALQEEIERVSTTVADKEKRLKTLKDIIKEQAMKSFRDGDKSVALKSKRYVWAVSRTERKDIDKDALKADGLLDKYSTKSVVTYKLTNKPVEEE